jgi:NADH:ubiquinone oxidoreductase subunit F (NADH-binding)
LLKAISQAHEYGLLGKDILGSHGSHGVTGRQCRGTSSQVYSYR